MSTMSERNRNVFISVVLFLVLNLQTCYGNYTCDTMSSGKDICFMLDASQQTFEESKQFCQNNGGFLLEIYNLEMQGLVEKFGKSKTTYLGNAWLNLVRTTSKVWVWGGEGSDKFLSYSNWDGVTPASYDGSLSHAFLNSVYKWMNSYDPQKASTICIQGNSEPYWLGSETTSTVIITTSVISVPAVDSATTNITTIKATTIAVESSKQTTSVAAMDSATTKITNVNTTTTLWSPKETESIPTADSTKTTNVNTATTSTTTTVESEKTSASFPAADSTTTRITAINVTTTTATTAATTTATTTAESPKETASVPTAEYPTTYTCYQLSSRKDICFMFDASKQTFEEAKQFCQNNGGFLLEIYDAEMERLVEQFGKSKTTYLGNAWLNLVRTTSKVWVWGGEGSDKILSYSNWDGDTPASYDGSISHAFLNSVYKWMNSYDPQKASTICIQGNSEPYWLGSETTSTVNTTTTVWSPKETASVPTADSTTTRITAINVTTTSKTTAAQSPKETASVPTAESPTTRTTTAKTSDSSKQITNSITSSTNISAATTTSTNTKLSQSTTKTFTLTATTSNSDLESSSAAGARVGLGGLVLIIVSSLLIAKFDFHKEIQLPFKSSRGSRNSPPHETGSDVINDGYEQLDGKKKRLDERSPHAEVVMNLRQTRPSTAMVSKT